MTRIIRVFPSTSKRPPLSGDRPTMNQLYFLWSALRTLQQAWNRRANDQEQRALEQYLSGARNAYELEYRERQWLRAHS